MKYRQCLFILLLIWNFFLFTGATAGADSGDVTDDFQNWFLCFPGGADANTTCPGHAMAVWADVDGINNGTVYDPYETMVIFTTVSGSACGIAPDISNRFYSHSFSDSACVPDGETCIIDDTCDRGRFVISFVDMTAPGFDQTNPATWVYKSVPSLSFILANSGGVPRAGAAIPYHQAKAYKIDGDPTAEPGAADLIDGTSTYEAPVGGSVVCEFSDPDDGIMEIWVRTDYDECRIDDFIIHSAAVPGVALLMDVSGSMSWGHDGSRPVPVEQQRLVMAKRAVEPFLDELLVHGDGEVDLGIARFPRDPYDGCNAESIMDMTLFNGASHGTANGHVSGLGAFGSTPMLAGLEQAQILLEHHDPKAIVLLSDGYHNCPETIEPSDPAYTDLLASLEGTKVYTIGFSRPGDVDGHFLDNLATDTGAEFNDVTAAPGFEPADWHPETALAATYNKILADGLGLDVLADPKKVISSGETHNHEISLNSSDQMVSFFLSWIKPQQDRLSLKVLASDGSDVTTLNTGFQVHSGDNYRVVTVEKELLQQKGKVGVAPWILRVSGPGIPSGETENYQYSVIADSRIKMRAHFDQRRYYTGDTVTLTVRITDAATPLKDLEKIEMQVTRPQDGQGNWFAAHKVSTEELAKIPQGLNDEKLPLIQRKAMYLTEISKIKVPGRTAPQTVQFYDDGTHGDRNAEDGLYTARFNDTVREGTYSFLIQANSKAGPDDLPFQREKLIQKHISVTPSAEHVVLMIDPLGVSDDNIRQFAVTVIPKDAIGNYFGPNKSSSVSLSASKGQFIGTVVDNLDGSYIQTLSLSEDVDVNTVDLTLAVGDSTHTFNLDDYTTPDGTSLFKWLFIVILLFIIFILLSILIKRRATQT